MQQIGYFGLAQYILLLRIAKIFGVHYDKDTVLSPSLNRSFQVASIDNSCDQEELLGPKKRARHLREMGFKPPM